MPDSLTVTSSLDDIVVVIHHQQPLGDEMFLVAHDPGGAPLLRVAEDGTARVTGPIRHAAGPVVLDSYATPIAHAFEGSETVTVSTTGLATFPNGIVLPIDATNPNGNIPGESGEMRIYDNGVDHFLAICVGGTLWRLSSPGT